MDLSPPAINDKISAAQRFCRKRQKRRGFGKMLFGKFDRAHAHDKPADQVSRFIVDPDAEGMSSWCESDEDLVRRSLADGRL